MSNLLSKRTKTEPKIIFLKKKLKKIIAVFISKHINE